MRAVLLGDRDEAPSALAVATVAGDPVVIVGMACRFPGGVAGPQDLLALFPAGQDPGKAPLQVRLPLALQDRLAVTRFAGQPNALSKDHHTWPVIDEVAAKAKP